MKIVSICNQKGGVSKTTTAINISSCLAELGKRVLVVDMDPQYNLTSGFGFDSTGKNTIHQCLLNDDIKITDVIYKTDFDNIDIIPANLGLANAEVELASAFSREQILNDKFSQVQLDYDYVFLDCNPALGFLTLNCLIASTDIIIPLEAGSFALEGITNLINLINKIQRKANKNLNILGVLLTRASRKTKINALFSAELRDFFGDKLFNTVIHQNVKIAEAQMENMPINHFNKNCTGYKEYLKLAMEVIERE